MAEESVRAGVVGNPENRSLPVFLSRSIEQVRAVLAPFPAIAACYVYGSAQQNRLRANSDVDIAVLLERGGALTLTQRLDLTDELQQIFNRQVDFGILDLKQLIYASQVISTGKVIYCRDDNWRMEFSGAVYSRYAQLRYERRVVEQAYAI